MVPSTSSKKDLGVVTLLVTAERRTGFFLSPRGFLLCACIVPFPVGGVWEFLHFLYLFIFINSYIKHYVSDYFLFKERSSKHFSKKGETEFKYHKIWIKKKISWNILNLLFWGEKKFLPVLQLAGETSKINFEQQTKTQIFYFQELWWYVELLLWGGNIYNG